MTDRTHSANDDLAPNLRQIRSKCRKKEAPHKNSRPISTGRHCMPKRRPVLEEARTKRARTFSNEHSRRHKKRQPDAAWRERGPHPRRHEGEVQTRVPAGSQEASTPGRGARSHAEPKKSSAESQKSRLRRESSPRQGLHEQPRASRRSSAHHPPRRHMTSSAQQRIRSSPRVRPKAPALHSRLPNVLHPRLEAEDPACPTVQHIPTTAQRREADNTFTPTNAPARTHPRPNTARPAGPEPEGGRGSAKIENSRPPRKGPAHFAKRRLTMT